MTRFTDMNTEGFEQADLDVLNAAYAKLILDAEYEADTHVIADGLNDAWAEGDTVETLVGRFLAQHPNWND